MLKVFLGDREGEIYNPSVYFDNQYEDEWITDNLSKRMIQDIDQSSVVSAHVIDSPFLGAITPKDLSGGVKLRAFGLQLLLRARPSGGPQQPSARSGRPGVFYSRYRRRGKMVTENEKMKNQLLFRTVTVTDFQIFIRQSNTYSSLKCSGQFFVKILRLLQHILPKVYRPS